jgi:DNA-binding NarL/FixJ family response regulator
MPVRILLADDHQIVRQGLKALLEQKGFIVAGEAADGHEAIQLAVKLRPDVALLDLVMPLINGINVARTILREFPNTKVILLTMHTEEQYVFDALRAGVSGYVVKTDAATDLAHAIDAVLRGAIFVSSKISGGIVQAYIENKGVAVDPLTPRERQVLQLIAEGKTTKEIASLLGISVKTGEAHRTKIMSKLGMHSIAGVVRYAIRHGMIDA